MKMEFNPLFNRAGIHCALAATNGVSSSFNRKALISMLETMNSENVTIRLSDNSPIQVSGKILDVHDLDVRALYPQMANDRLVPAIAILSPVRIIKNEVEE